MTAGVASEIRLRRDWADERVAAATRRVELGFLPALSLVVAAGVVLLAFADNLARSGRAHAMAFYWFGVVMVVVPVAARLTREACSRAERIGLVLVVGIGTYLLKLMTWPLGFAFHDDLGQLRTSLDIGSTHHLFSSNPIVGAYAYYPGLEEVTNALATVSGISPTAAGFVIVGAARIILVIALFRLFELASGCARVAGIAVLIYAANPNFVYFDGQVAYESLALPLAAAALCAVAARGAEEVDRDDAGERRSWVNLLIGCALVAATVVSHHMAAYFLTAFLVAWVLIGGSKRFWAPPRGSLALAAFSLAATIGWLLFAGPATQRELGTIPGSAAASVWDLVFGSSGPRQLFHAGNGNAEPLLSQSIGFAAVVLVLALLPFGVRRTIRKGNAVSLVLLGLAALYPVSLLLRLTSAGTETSSRASEFVFLGVAYVIALAVVGRTSETPATRRFLNSSRFMTPWFAAYAGIVFAGGLIIGWAPVARLPGPFEVGSPPRSITPEGIATANWMGRAVSPNKTLLADSTNALLLGSYGRQAPTDTPIPALPLLKLYRDPTLTRLDREALDEVDYLVADRRLTSAVPVNGGYFGAHDYELGLTRPLPPVGLRKFDRARGVARIYDSGNIAIYRTRGA